MAEKMLKTERNTELGMLVVIGGPGGSGSSTISKLVAEKYNLTHHYAGGIFRELARENGHESVKDFLAMVEAKKGNDYDLEVDNRMIKASQSPNVLIEAKSFAALATMKNIPCTAKIWITADVDTRVRRVLAKKEILGFGKPVTKNLINIYEEEKKNLLERQDINSKRLNFLYGIEYERPELYNDMVVDSSNQSVEETFNLICKKIEEMEEKKKGNVNVPANGNGKSMDDLEVNWRRWKCLVCGYVYEGTDIRLKCPKCGNEDPMKFRDID